MPTPDLDLSATVTRQTVPGGPLADLAFDADGIYELVSVDRGATTKRRITAGSESMDGAANVSSVKEMSALTLTVRVRGASLAEVDSRLQTVREAFDQASYQVTLTIGGSTQTYDCWDYDSEAPVDGDWNKYELMASPPRQTYRFVIPRLPTPVAGHLL